MFRFVGPCTGLFFTRVTYFYSISVLYPLRKNLFTFGIPVSSERWPVLIYPLSSQKLSPHLPTPVSIIPPSRQPISNATPNATPSSFWISHSHITPFDWRPARNFWQYWESIKKWRLLESTRHSWVVLSLHCQTTRRGWCVLYGVLQRQWDRCSTPGNEMRLCFVLLGGEFLHGLNTRWKLSWRYELAGSFPVRRPGVNQGLSQWQRPLLAYLLLPLFFYSPPLLWHPPTSRKSKKYIFFLSSPISSVFVPLSPAP